MLSITLKNHKLITLCLLSTVSATFAGPYTWWNATKGALNTAGKAIFSHKATYALPIGATTTYIVNTINDNKRFLDTFELMHYSLNNNERFDKQAKEDILGIQKFIHEELKKQSYPNPEQIRVIPAPQGHGPSAAYDFFLVDKTMRNNCKKAGILQKPLVPISEEEEKMYQTLLNEIKCIIGHEAGHLRANDTSKKIAVYYSTASLTCLSGLALVRKINSYIGSTRIKGLLTTLSTLPIFCVSLLTQRAYDRFIESRADEHVPNEPDYLKGGITLFEWATSHEKKSTPNVYNSKRSYLLSDHPTSESRANRFKERLEKLDQQKA